MSIELVRPSNNLIVPLASCLQSFPASGSFLMSQLFPSRGQNIGVSASTSVLPMNIQSIRMDWLALLAVQGTLKSLFQHHSSEASNLRCSAFFIVQLLHPYMTTVISFEMLVIHRAVVQLLSHVQLFVTPSLAACQPSLSFTISWSLLQFMSIESVMPSILCRLTPNPSYSLNIYCSELAPDKILR